MESGPGRPHAREYIANLAASGRYHFTSLEAQKGLGVTAAAAKLALNRLAKQGLVASPARGYYVVVPPEYRSIGCLPADQFIPSLMARLNQLYYVGLLSAAQYYGAAHHRPQEFQIFLAKSRRPIRCGAVRVVFMLHRRLAAVPTQSFNTPRGTILVSSPEATAFDLVGYVQNAGGLNQVATVLSELAERIDPKKLAAAAQTVPIGWAQRLGYLLDHLGFDAKTPALKEYVRTNAKRSSVLSLQATTKHSRRNKSWKLDVNAKVEAEL